MYLSSCCYRAGVREEVGVYSGVRSGFDADIMIAYKEMFHDWTETDEVQLHVCHACVYLFTQFNKPPVCDNANMVPLRYLGIND
jgi:hypothetical protein